MMTEKQLLDIKKDIENAKEELLKSKGRRQVLTDSLEKDFGCKTIEQAKKEYGKIKKDIEDLEARKEEKIEQLENEYEF